MAVNKDFKKCKTNRLELDDLQSTNLGKTFKMIYCFESWKCYFHFLKTIYNWGKSHDDTQLFYHNAIEMLLLTDKLNLKCYVLY